MCIRDSYTELSQNIVEGFTREQTYITERNVTPYGIERHRYYNTQRTWDINYRAIPSTDIDSISAMASAVADRDSGTLKPVWFNLDSTDADELYLTRMDGVRVEHWSGNRYHLPLQLREVLKSV